MGCTLRRFAAFERHLKTVLKKYPNSTNAIDQEIAALAVNPECGFSYPGFSPFAVRKIRIGLRAYRLSASEGLRLIFLHLPEKAIVAPLVIYKKGAIASEHEVKRLVLSALHEIVEELK